MYICRNLNPLRKIHTGWLIVSVYTLFAIVLLLFMEGMFMDGVLYSAVARNLALGKGTFWNPSFSQAMHWEFHEQPPFMLWLQSLFFDVFGTENSYPERIYCLVFLVPTVGALAAFWNKATAAKTQAWWPVLLFLVIPTVSWGFINNVMENTMSLFDLLVVYFVYRYMAEDKKAALLIPAVLFLFLASFTKGIQGLFPVAAPVLYSWAIERKILSKKAFIAGAVLLLGMVVIYFAMVQIPAAKQSYVLYFQSRFPNFPNTPHSNTGNRLKLLENLVSELVVPIAALAVLAIANYFNNKLKPVEKANLQKAWFFLLVALSASLPIMVSYEQRGFYLNTSIPFFALALAVAFVPLSKGFDGLFKPTVLKGFRVILLLAFMAGIGLTVVKAGHPKRDADKLHDIAIIRYHLGDGITIYCNAELWTDWSMHNYLQRYGEISLSKNEPPVGSYYIQLLQDKTPIPVGMQLVIEKECYWVQVYRMEK